MTKGKALKESWIEGFVIGCIKNLAKIILANHHTTAFSMVLTTDNKGRVKGCVGTTALPRMFT